MSMYEQFESFDPGVRGDYQTLSPLNTRILNEHVTVARATRLKLSSAQVRYYQNELTGKGPLGEAYPEARYASAYFIDATRPSNERRLLNYSVWTEILHLPDGVTTQGYSVIDDSVMMLMELLGNFFFEKGSELAKIFSIADYMSTINHFLQGKAEAYRCQGELHNYVYDYIRNTKGVEVQVYIKKLFDGMFGFNHGDVTPIVLAGPAYADNPTQWMHVTGLTHQELQTRIELYAKVNESGFLANMLQVTYENLFWGKSTRTLPHIHPDQDNPIYGHDARLFFLREELNRLIPSFQVARQVGFHEATHSIDLLIRYLILGGAVGDSFITEGIAGALSMDRRQERATTFDLHDIFQASDTKDSYKKLYTAGPRFFFSVAVAFAIKNNIHPLEMRSAWAAILGESLLYGLATQSTTAISPDQVNCITVDYLNTLVERLQLTIEEINSVFQTPHSFRAYDLFGNYFEKTKPEFYASDFKILPLLSPKDQEMLIKAVRGKRIIEAQL